MQHYVENVGKAVQRPPKRKLGVDPRDTEAKPAVPSSLYNSTESIGTWRFYSDARQTARCLELCIESNVIETAAEDFRGRC